MMVPKFVMVLGWNWYYLKKNHNTNTGTGTMFIYMSGTQSDTKKQTPNRSYKPGPIGCQVGESILMWISYFLD